jgi:hypothetical protein|tara:strand:+ start:2615 stop:2860 length:246 start_codon:yes stop_codon:yes gene_type:complete
MKDTLETIKGLVGGVTMVLLSVIGLLVVSQVVFGETTSINVIGNLQAILNGFVGEGASLAGVITLLLVVALLQKSTGKDKN